MTGAFSLLELLLVIGVIATLSALLLPALSQAKRAAQRSQCMSGLHQLGLSVQMYWDDNAGNCFPYLLSNDVAGATYWFGWIENGSEGSRRFDASRGPLYDYYLKCSAIGVCPSLDYYSAQFKLKAKGASFGYGYNLNLGPSLAANKLPVNTISVRTPSSIALMADAGQINTWQSPASPKNPLLEEFYYVNSAEATAHFRHKSKANVLFMDQHIGAESMIPESLDTRLPQMNVGRLRRDIIEIK